MLSGRPGGAGIVSVTTIFSRPDFVGQPLEAGPLKTPWWRRRSPTWRPRRGRCGGGADMPAGVDHVVGDDRDLVRGRPRPRSRSRRPAALGRSFSMIAHSVPTLRAKLAGSLGATSVRGDDHQVLKPGWSANHWVMHQLGGHVVDRDREEALDLAGVKVHGQDPVDTTASSERATTRECNRLSRGTTSCPAGGHPNQGMTAMIRWADAPGGVGHHQRVPSGRRSASCPSRRWRRSAGQGRRQRRRSIPRSGRRPRRRKGLQGVTSPTERSKLAGDLRGQVLGAPAANTIARFE